MTPERRQLHRLRWRGTLLFAATTAICLVVLAAMASSIDSQSHTRETIRELSETARQLSHAAYSSGSGAEARIDPTSLGLWAATHGVFGYVDPGGIMVAVPSQDALPSSAEIYSLMSRARQGEGPVTSEAPRVDDDEPFHWVAIAVPYSDTVVLTGAPATATVEHRRLDVVLALTVIALCIVGTGLGHVLSGLAMRPAIRSIEQHEQFLREAAHELRTPLAVMRLALDSNDEGGQSETLSAQLGRMSSLVGRLLDRARIRSADPSSFQLGPVRLDQVVEVAVEELDGADLVLLDLDQTVVVGHADLLAQAVRNLVENALHHGAGPVEIELHGGVLEVSDSGSGIPMSKRREVLQGGRTTAAGTGTGTGLAIVDWVAEIHHARLSLRDAVPHGLRVQLTFPMSHIRGSR